MKWRDFEKWVEYFPIPQMKNWQQLSTPACPNHHPERQYEGE